MIGRGGLIRGLLDQLRSAQTVLLLGPLGAGKSAVVAELADRLRAEGRRCGFVSSTGSLRDMTEAAASAYPDLAVAVPTQGSIRRALSREMEEHPPVILLDGLSNATGPMRKYLHVLQGRGVGVLLAADSENERDHQRIRRMRLAYREVQIPRLEARFIREILDALVPGTWIEDLALVARGNPGRAKRAAELAHEQRYWSNGLLLRAALETDLDTEFAKRRMIPAIKQ